MATWQSGCPEAEMMETGITNEPSELGDSLRQELGKTFFRGCLKWSSRRRTPGVCRVAERGPGPGSAAEPGGASAPGTTWGSAGKQRIWLGCSCDRSCISYRFHTQLLCVDMSGVDWGAVVRLGTSDSTVGASAEPGSPNPQLCRQHRPNFPLNAYPRTC